MVLRVGFGDRADRHGGWPAIAMATRGHAGEGARDRVARDPACAHRLQDDAGQDRPKGRSWHCAADANGLVSPGPLQVCAGSGNARTAERAQIDLEQAARSGEWTTWHPSWF